MNANEKRYIVRSTDDVEPVKCSCGSSTRVITRTDTETASLHVTHIQDSRKHYHEHCTEYYYIVEGNGRMELDDDVVELKPGTTIVIEPGTAHRGWGDFKAVIVGIPAWDEKDEVLCD